MQKVISELHLFYFIFKYTKEKVLITNLLFNFMPVDDFGEGWMFISPEFLVIHTDIEEGGEQNNKNILPRKMENDSQLL